MKIINSLKISNYRSIISEEISFDEIISIIGANESGKSNILNAIYHISKEKQNIPFEKCEQNLSIRHKSDNIIKLEYEITLKKQLIPYSSKQIPDLIDKKILLVKKGKPDQNVNWTSIFKTKPNIGNLVKINNKNTFIKKMKEKGTNNELLEEISNNKWFISGGDFNLTKNPFHKMIQDHVIDMVEIENKEEFIGEILQREIMQNISLFFWEFKESYYLKEMINLEDFCENYTITKYKTILGILKIAKQENAFSFEITKNNLKEYILNSDSTSRVNLLDEISKKFNKVFNKSWNTFWGNQRVKLKIAFEENNLCFRFHDGRDCPPEYRSDGFKWFVTFLINFKSMEKTLSNYILLIDEPGGTLHPKGQKDTLNFINKLSPHNQIIYSTHQIFLIDKNEPRRIRILERTLKDSVNNFWPTCVNSIENPREHILKDSLLRESLGFTLTDISPINEKNILVEGTFDRKLLQYCNSKFKILDLNYISIIECGKATNIVYSAKQYLSNKLKVLCLYDKDNAGITAYYKNNIDDKYKIYVCESPNETIEDLLPENILNKSYSSVYKKYKNYLNKIDPIEKPFIKKVFNKSYKRGLAKDVKTEIKHYFEDAMIKYIEKDFNSTDFNSFEELLNKIDRNLR